MFLKRKRNRKMKGRGCAGSLPQQEYITKEESSPPTVLLYIVMGSCVINALDEK